MGNDINVGVGIQVTGDASGAREVDGAIKQVGQTAQQVARETGDAAAQAAQASASAAGAAADAATEQIGELKSAMEAPSGDSGLDKELLNLKSALDTLSPEKAKGAVSGLANAITGMAAGDTSKGLAGIGQALFSISQSIPIPGVALASALAITGLATAFKFLKDDSAGVAGQLSEIGLTVDEEMANLESWANAELDWSNLQSGFSGVKDEISAAGKLSDTVRDSLKQTFDRIYTVQIEGLKSDLQAAKDAGDALRAAAIEIRLKEAEQVLAIVTNTTALDGLKAKLEIQIAQAELQRKAIEQQEIAAQASVERMDALISGVVGATGSSDAAFSSDTSAGMRASLISDLTDKISSLSGQIESLRNANGRADVTSIWGLVPGTEEAASAPAQLEGMKKLRQELLDFDKIAEAAAKGQEFLNETSFKEVQELDQQVADIVQTKAEVSAAEAALSQSIQGVDAGIQQAAQDHVTGMRETNDAIISTIQEGVDNLTPIPTLLETLKGAGSKSKEGIEVLGSELEKSSETSAGQISAGTELIKASTETLGTEALAAGGVVKEGAEKFRDQLVSLLGIWNPAISGLVDNSRKTLEMVSRLATAQAEISQQVASAQSTSNEALASASLARQQIRNLA